MTQYRNILFLFMFINIPILTEFTTQITNEGTTTHITIFRDNTFIKTLSIDLHFQYNIASHLIIKPIDHAIATDHYLITHSNASSVYDTIAHIYPPPPMDLISIWDLATGKNIQAISIINAVQSIRWNQSANSLIIVYENQIPDSEKSLQSLIVDAKLCDGLYKNDAIITVVPPVVPLFTLSRCGIVVVTLACIYAIYKFIKRKKNDTTQDEIDNNNQVLTPKALTHDTIYPYNNTEVTITDSI